MQSECSEMDYTNKKNEEDLFDVGFFLTSDSPYHLKQCSLLHAEYTPMSFKGGACGFITAYLVFTSLDT